MKIVHFIHSLMLLISVLLLTHRQLHILNTEKNVQDRFQLIPAYTLSIFKFFSVDKQNGKTS